MIIAFSFLSLLNENYKDNIIKFNQFDKDGWMHFDVMDGKFVTNTTFDSSLIKEINSYNKLFSDVHLMISEPSEVIEDYSRCNIDQLTFHYEAVNEEKIMEIINKIKANNMKVGISIKPNTNVQVLDKYLPYLDYILIMSVEPGRGGQKFMENSLEKIRYLKELQAKYHYLIGVDGGINNNTSSLVKEAGADVVIVGSYLSLNLNIDTINALK